MGIFKKKTVYEDPYQEYNNYGVNIIDFNENQEKKSKIIINIIFIIILAIMIMISVDIIAVTKYQTGPFFAIRTSIYNDGGTSVYHGVGYKVIKYNQQQGRKDIQIGTWSLKYSVKPITISTLDLALQLRNYPIQTSKKLAGSLLKITGEVTKIDNKNNKVVLKFNDPDKAYTLELITKLAVESKKPSNKQKGQSITILGTVSKISLKTNSTPNQVYINNGFIK